MNKMIGYCRVSTDIQAEEGYSLQAQKQDIERYCQLYGLELVDIIYDEGLSACNLEREGIQKALKMISVGMVDGLIVAKLDRLTRSVRDLSYLLEKYFTKYALMSVADKIDTTSASGRLVLNIIMSVAQWEREAISERTKKAMDVKKVNGERVGGIPYGKRLSADGIHLEDEPWEMKTIEHIKSLKSSGFTLRMIKDHLSLRKQDGTTCYFSRNGKPFGVSAIHRMLNT